MVVWAFSLFHKGGVCTQPISSFTKCWFRGLPYNWLDLSHPGCCDLQTEILLPQKNSLFPFCSKFLYKVPDLSISLQV